MDGANDAKPDNFVVGLIRSTGFFTIQIPKQIVLGDMRWGFLDKFLQGTVGALLLYQMFVNHAYELRHPANGALRSSWMDRSNFVARMQTAADAAYCKQPYSYDYRFCNRTSSSGYFNEFWCEEDITCENVDPAFALKKQTPMDIWMYTYVKRRTTRRVDCALRSAACGAHELIEDLGARCQCVHTRNSFITGADGAAYIFRHQAKLDVPVTPEQERMLREMETIIVSDVLDPATGETIEAEREQKRFEMNADGTMPSIRLNLDDLLQWTGLGDLDQADPSVVEINQQYYQSGTPSLRITGIQFDVRVVYEGSLSAADRPPKAKLKIKAQLGWHARGEIVYQDDEHYLGDAAGYLESPTGDSYSVYPRGVHIKVSFGGYIGQMQLMYLVTQIAATIVLVRIAQLVVRYMVLYLLGYTSRVYRESIREVVTVDNVHAKKASQAIISAVTFAKLRADAAARADETKTGGAYFRQTVLEELKNAGLEDGEARGIAQIVAPYGAIDFNKFVDRAATLSSLGVQDIAQFVTKAESKKLGAEAVPPLQPTL